MRAALVVLSGIERGSIWSIKDSRAGCEEGCSSADGYGSAVVGCWVGTRIIATVLRIVHYKSVKRTRP